MGGDHLPTSLDAHGAACPDHHPIDRHPAPHREVGAGPGRREIREVGRHPQPPPAVLRVRADAHRFGGVEVLTEWVPGGQGGIEKPGHGWEQLIAAPASDGDGPSGPMVAAIAKLLIGLEPTIRGQHPLPAPRGQAQTGPGVEVSRRGPHHAGAIGLRRAADDLAPRQEPFALATDSHLQVPVVAPEGSLVAVAQRLGQSGLVRVIGTGLEHQHSTRRVFAESGSQNGAGGPRADDQVINAGHARTIRHKAPASKIMRSSSLRPYDQALSGRRPGVRSNDGSSCRSAPAP